MGGGGRGGGIDGANDRTRMCDGFIVATHCRWSSWGEDCWSWVMKRRGAGKGGGRGRKVIEGSSKREEYEWEWGFEGGESPLRGTLRGRKVMQKERWQRNSERRWKFRVDN